MLGIAGMWYSARGVTGLRGIIIGFGSTPALIGSLVAVILGRKRSFAVTSKERQGQRSLGYLGVYVFFVLLCVAALAWATQVTGRQQTSMFISLLWVVYSLLLLGSFLWLARADIRAHAAEQQSGVTDITAKQPYPAKLLNAPRNGLRPVVNLGFAALMASPVLLGAPLGSLSIFARPAPPFAITGSQVDARYAGVSLPVQSLLSDPPILEHDLGIRFSLIGRTQDITDRFDTAWADKLAAQGAHPWITLQFGNFGPRHKPPLAANLAAIYNGVDDQDLRRWAAEIRDFGKPVYLTVLLQVDKNWAVSSAVANGGIPQDVPKAWEYIQSVFRAVGATTSPGYGRRLILSMISRTHHHHQPSTWCCRTSSTSRERTGGIRSRRCAAWSSGTRESPLSSRSAPLDRRRRRQRGSPGWDGRSMTARGVCPPVPRRRTDPQANRCPIEELVAGVRP